MKREDFKRCAADVATPLLQPIVKLIFANHVMNPARVRDPRRTGGWFAFWRDDPNGRELIPVTQFPVGYLPAERFGRCIHFANEQAIRLGKFPEDISSWQSRDEHSNYLLRKRGGAIRADYGVIFSFSGFSEHENELIATVAAEKVLLLNRGQVEDIMRASENERLLAYYTQETGVNLPAPWIPSLKQSTTEPIGGSHE